MTENIIKARTDIFGPGLEISELIKKKFITIDFDNLKVLDIGFNDPSSFILLQHKYGLSRYIGIDTIESNEFNINLSFDLNVPIPEETIINGNSIPYDYYELFYKYVLSQIEGKQILMLSKIDFDGIFEFQFETSVQEYIEGGFHGEYQPNLLVLSNLLHLIEDKKEAFKAFTSLLEKVSDNGLIWLKVYNSKSSSNSVRFPYSFSDIENLKSEMVCIYEEEQNDKTLIVGWKK